MSAPHRWSKFWWQDWRSDNGLRMCSLGARGLWMEMLCIASESPSYGRVAVNMKPLSASDLSRILGVNLREVKRYIDELERNGVFSRTEDGTIYCRRMVRDHAASEGAKAAGAHGGGNPQIIRGTVPKDERQRRYRRSDSPLKTQRILDKSNGCCHWCGILLQCDVPGADFFHVDHVIAVRDGGGIEEENLVAACSACNYRRARHDPGDNTPTDTNTDGDGKPNGQATSDHKVGKHRPQLRPQTLYSEAESESKKDTNLRFADTAAPRGGQFPQPDIVTELFGDGLAIVRNLTGRSESACRTLIGSWRRDAGDDSAAVLQAIRRAGHMHPADPVGFIAKALRPRRAMTLEERCLAMLDAQGEA